jgi:hypothetical protein
MCVIEPLPFQPPSQEMLELLHACEEHRTALCRALLYDWEHDELPWFAELTPLQTDALLTRGTL